jgi:CRP/FNR family transcriptional regulator, cyclic AMP receptor protein
LRTLTPENSARLEQVLPPGSVVFNEGDAADYMYVIQAGSVQITRAVGAQEALLAVLGPGEFFGEMAIVNNRPRSATATTLEDTRLLSIDAKTLESMLRSNTEIAVRLIQKLADRLEQTNRQVEVLLYREPNHRVVYYLRQVADASGQPHAAGTLVYVNQAEFVDRLGLSAQEVQQVLNRLELSKLVTQEEGGGFIIAEVGRLQDFLDFLDMKSRYQG